MKRIAAFLLALALCFGLCACGADDSSREDKASSRKVEGSGYSSPEAAMRAYIKALKSADVSKILSTFAVETYVENFDMEDYTEHFPILVIGSLPLESWDGYTEDISLIRRQNQIVQDLSNMSLVLRLGYDTVCETVSVHLTDEGKKEAYLSKLRETDLEKILKQMEDDSEFFYARDFRDEESFIKISRGYTEAQGFDEIVPLAVKVTLDGRQYYLCMDVIRYGSKWYNLRSAGLMESMLNATAMAGGLVPVE